MIAVKCYSTKGLVVKGATAEQAEAIRAGLGASVVTGFNARLGGWVFSRKREDRIRELVTMMRGDGSIQAGVAKVMAAHPVQFTTPEKANWGFPLSVPVTLAREYSELPPDDPRVIAAFHASDTMPGEWGALAG